MVQLVLDLIALQPVADKIGKPYTYAADDESYAVRGEDNPFEEGGVWGRVHMKFFYDAIKCDGCFTKLSLSL